MCLLAMTAKDRSLVINEIEAKTVRTLFRLYLELGSVRALQAEAQRRGLRGKTGQPFSYGHLYFLLQNPIYIGLIRHKKGDLSWSASPHHRPGHLGYGAATAQRASRRPA